MGWLWDSDEEKMSKSLMNLKMAVKTLARESKKCEATMKKEKLLVKKAIEKNNMEGARIHAENSIRNKNQALQYLKMSARVDGVASRVQTAVTTQNVTKNMCNVCTTMEHVMSSMNLEKISEMMARFERQFDNLDVQSKVMDGAMEGTNAQFCPEDDVMHLMQEEADSAGIALNLNMPEVSSTNPVGTSTGIQQPGDVDADLGMKLRALRNDD